MIPRRVVPYIVFDHILRPYELVLFVKQVEALHQPLAVAPDMIVLRVLFEHSRDKVGLAFRRTEGIHNGLAVVPYLVVLEVLEGSRVEPFNFLPEVGFEFTECLCTIQPERVSMEFC